MAGIGCLAYFGDGLPRSTATRPRKHPGKQALEHSNTSYEQRQRRKPQSAWSAGFGLIVMKSTGNRDSAIQGLSPASYRLCWRGFSPPRQQAQRCGGHSSGGFGDLEGRNRSGLFHGSRGRGIADFALAQGFYPSLPPYKFHHGSHVTQSIPKFAASQSSDRWTSHALSATCKSFQKLRHPRRIFHPAQAKPGELARNNCKASQLLSTFYGKLGALPVKNIRSTSFPASSRKICREP